MGSERLSARAVDAKVDDLAGKLDRVVDSTNDALAVQTEALAKITEQLSRLTDAINNPVIITKGVEAASQDMGKDHVAEFNDEGLIEKPRLMSVDTPEFKEKNELWAFMHEKVEVEIHEVSDKDAAQMFMVGVNGRQRVLRRGERTFLERYYVEVLARARPVNYNNEEFVDGDGTRKVRYPSRRGLLYPFTVVTDSDRGKEWLRKVLRAA